MEPLYAGVDAGGSTCRVVVCSRDGRQTSWGLGGGANPNHAGWDGAGRAIGDALDAALGGLPREALRGVFLGMAGVISEKDRALAEGLASAWNLPEECRVAADHDIRIALEGGLSGRPGIALIAGTGSACYGRNAAGEWWQAGGWDSLLDDLGSGYDIARRGMAAAVQGADGRLRYSRLSSIFFKQLGASDSIEFCARLKEPGMARHDIAAMSPLVVQTARDGDPEAQRILTEGARELARMVAAVAAKRFGENAVEVVFIGGLLEGSGDYRELAAREILLARPGAIIRRPELRPAIGAVSLAARLAEEPIPHAVLHRLSQSHP